MVDTGSFTARERRVLALLREGLSNSEIADVLTTSPHTVARLVERMVAKAGATDRAQLATRPA